MHTYVQMHMLVLQYVCGGRSEENLESGSLLPLWVPKDQSQVARLDGKYLYLLIHLAFAEV